MVRPLSLTLTPPRIFRIWFELFPTYPGKYDRVPTVFRRESFGTIRRKMNEKHRRALGNYDLRGPKQRMATEAKWLHREGTQAESGPEFTE